jgi:hypothetical protein
VPPVVSVSVSGSELDAVLNDLQQLKVKKVLSVWLSKYYTRCQGERHYLVALRLACQTRSETARRYVIQSVWRRSQGAGLLGGSRRVAHDLEALP